MKAVTNNTSRGIATTMIVDIGFKNEKEWEEPLEVKKGGGGGGKSKSFGRRKRNARPEGHPKPQRPQPINEIIRKAVGETPRALGPVMTPEKRMTALASGAQASVVKMISVGGGRTSASNMVAYNSREAAMPLERENGEMVTTKAEQSAMLDEWEALFDKREPSKDAVTLTVTIAGEGAASAVREALEDIYKDQRLAIGETTDAEGRQQIVVVMSIASAGKGRIKTTDQALEKVHEQLRERLGAAAPHLSLEYGKATHGVAGLTKELDAAVKRAGTLTSGRDGEINAENIQAVAKGWEKDLRSYGPRDVMHIAISAKAGTDQSAFLEAVRDFLGHEFAEHKYAFALHGPHDTAIDKRTQESKATDHVHVHAMIVMRSISGRKLDPNIRDFQRWRENMAHFAQERGINMVATRRAENVNAPNFTKAEHEAVKANVAGETIRKKVKTKQDREPVMPRQPAGVLAAGQGRAALETVLKEAGKSGDNVVSIAALQMAKRHDAAFTEAKLGNVQLDRLDAAAQVISSLTALSEMLQQDSRRTLDAPQRKVLESSLDRYQQIVGKISESMRGDPQLKAAFDDKTRAALDALFQPERSRTHERDKAAEPSKLASVEPRAEDKATRDFSRDAVTLNVTIDGGTDIAKVRNALKEVYREQRLVMGDALDGEGRQQLVVVMSIASTGKGRIKTTDHALEKVRDQLREKLGDAGASRLSLEYGKAVHGVAGLAKEMEAAANRAGTLTGPRDKEITAENVQAAAKKWERDLRTSIRKRAQESDGIENEDSVSQKPQPGRMDDHPTVERKRPPR
ncbi:relaxase/mobilization nuclease domain-containing protein [Brucella endophytica]|nr:relaxase/mobilization nuclease domain-containing protein [Brucella endophytica]